MEQPSVRESSARIDELLDDLEQSAVPAVLERVQELLSCVMALYGAGLDRTIDLVLEAGQLDLARRLADDEIVGNLLVLHDLHPDDVETRVNDALERVRPYLGSHAGGVEYLGIDDAGVVHLRLEGTCHGCPSSTVTVRTSRICEQSPEQFSSKWIRRRTAAAAVRHRVRLKRAAKVQLLCA